MRLLFFSLLLYLSSILTATAETTFACSGDDGQLYFVYDKANGFDFDGRGFQPPSFDGYYFDLSQRLAFQSNQRGDGGTPQKHAVVTYQKEYSRFDYLTKLNNMKPIVAEWLDDFDEALYQVTNSYEFNTTTYKLTEVELIIGDIVSASTKNYQCSISASVFD